MNNETAQIVEILTKALIELAKVSASPGDKSHRLWETTKRIEKLLTRVVDYKIGKPK